MALLTLVDARVLGDGRVLRTEFQARPAPAAGLPDWMPGAVEGQALLLGDVPCALMGLISRDFNAPAAELEARTNAASTLPPGRYTARFCVADATGAEVRVHDVSGDFGSHQNGKTVAAGQELRVSWEDPIPAGHTGRIYMAGAPGPVADVAGPGALISDHRLLVDGIPAGSTGWSVAGPLTHVDPNKTPDPALAWVALWLIPESRTVAYGAAGLSVAAPEGLVRDELGNRTAGFAAAPVQNLSIVEADGWTTDRFLRSANALELHVSDQYGLDTNPGTPERPLKSVAAAFTRLPLSSGSVVRLRRGETFPLAASLAMRWGVTGDPSRPLILEDYWRAYTEGEQDPGTRPIVRGDASNGSIILYHTGYGPSFENMLIRRIHFRCGASDRTAAITWLNKATNVAISDCVLDRVNFGGQSPTPMTSRRVMQHRCVVYDNSTDQPSHVQGHFSHGVRDVLISQCMFDRNGYPAANYSARDLYCHNIYLQYSVIEAVIWGTWLLRGGSHGLQLRCSGVITENVFSRNALDCLVGRGSGTIARNVMMNSEDLTTSGGQRGLSIDTGETREAPANHVVIEFNILLRSLGGQPAGISFLTTDEPAFPKKRYEVARHNLCLDHGRALRIATSTPLAGVWRRNIAVARHPVDTYQRIVSAALTTVSAVECSWLDADENAYHSPCPQPFRWQTSKTGDLWTFDQWRAAVAGEGRSMMLAQAPAFASASFGLPEFSAACGGPADEEGFRQVLRARPPRTWAPIYDATAARAAFVAAYTPTDLPALGAGPFDFMGPADPRVGVGPSYDLQAPAAGRAGQPIELVATPQGAADEELSLVDEGAGGRFDPPRLAWTGGAAPLTVRYTPARAGAVTLRLLRGAVTVALATVRVEPRGGGLALRRCRRMTGGLSSGVD